MIKKQVNVPVPAADPAVAVPSRNPVTERKQNNNKPSENSEGFSHGFIMLLLEAKPVVKEIYFPAILKINPFVYPLISVR